MIAWLQKKYALSQQGAKDLVKGCFACLLQNLSFMVPVGLLFLFVRDLMAGGVTGGGRVAFYLAGCLVCLVLIFLTTWFQYNATYFATYVESGVRRVTLAERLRQIPLSFFGKKDLSDLTSTIMADCTFLEQSFSHFIPELVGSICSTVLVAVGLLFVDWRMAGTMGAAGVLRHCGGIGQSPGADEPESHGCQDGCRRWDPRVH